MNPLTTAPQNEMGVVFLFGAMARELGFVVLKIRPGFPDCIALRRLASGKWQWVRIEFEFESRNFLLHGHDPAGCDLICVLGEQLAGVSAGGGGTEENCQNCHDCQN